MCEKSKEKKQQCGIMGLIRNRVTGIGKYVRFQCGCWNCPNCVNRRREKALLRFEKSVVKFDLWNCYDVSEREWDALRQALQYHKLPWVKFHKHNGKLTILHAAFPSNARREPKLAMTQDTAREAARSLAYQSRVVKFSWRCEKPTPKESYWGLIAHINASAEEFSNKLLAPIHTRIFEGVEMSKDMLNTVALFMIKSGMTVANDTVSHLQECTISVSRSLKLVEKHIEEAVLVRKNDIKSAEISYLESVREQENFRHRYQEYLV